MDGLMMMNQKNSSEESEESEESESDEEDLPYFMVDFYLARVNANTYLNPMIATGHVQVELQCKAPSFKNHLGSEYCLVAMVDANYVLVHQSSREALFNAMMDIPPHHGFKAMLLHPDPSCFLQKLGNRSFPYATFCAAIATADIRQVLVTQHGANIPSVAWYQQWSSHLVRGSRVRFDMACDEKSSRVLCVALEARPHPALSLSLHKAGGLPAQGCGGLTWVNNSLGTYLADTHTTNPNSLHLVKVVQYSHVWVSSLKAMMVGSNAKFMAASHHKCKKKLFEIMSTLKAMWEFFVRKREPAEEKEDGEDSSSSTEEDPVFSRGHTNHQVNRIESTVDVGTAMLARIMQVGGRRSPLIKSLDQLRVFVEAKEYWNSKGREPKTKWKFALRTPKQIIKHTATLVHLTYLAVKHYDPVEGNICCPQIAAMIAQTSSAMMGADTTGSTNSSETFNPHWRTQHHFGAILHHYLPRLIQEAAEVPVYGYDALEEAQVTDAALEAQFPDSRAGMPTSQYNAYVTGYVPKALLPAAADLYEAMVSQDPRTPTVPAAQLLRALKRVLIGFRISKNKVVGYSVSWKTREKNGKPTSATHGSLIIMYHPTIVGVLKRALIRFPKTWRSVLKCNPQYEGWYSEEEEETDDESSDDDDDDDEEDDPPLPATTVATLLKLIKEGKMGDRSVVKRHHNKNDSLLNGAETDAQAQARRRRQKARRKEKVKKEAVADMEKKKEKKRAKKKNKKNKKVLKKMKERHLTQLAKARASRRAKAAAAKQAALDAQQGDDELEDVEDTHWELFVESGYEVEEEEQDDDDEEDITLSDNHQYYGSKIEKVFNGATFHGVVGHLSTIPGEVAFYKVLYDDGDREDMTLLQVRAAMDRYDMNVMNGVAL